jgi:hypothetical protein
MRRRRRRRCRWITIISLARLAFFINDTECCKKQRNKETMHGSGRHHTSWQEWMRLREGRKEGRREKKVPEE